MSYVVNDPCIGSVDGSCVEVCPVSCIYGVGQDSDEAKMPYMMVIDPEECIACGACVTECPVDAITTIDAVPDKWSDFVKLGQLHEGRGNQDGEVAPDESKNDIADEAKLLHLALAETHDG